MFSKKIISTIRCLTDGAYI